MMKLPECESDVFKKIKRYRIFHCAISKTNHCNLILHLRNNKINDRVVAYEYYWCILMRTEILYVKLFPLSC